MSAPFDRDELYRLFGQLTDGTLAENDHGVSSRF